MVATKNKTNGGSGKRRLNAASTASVLAIHYDLGEHMVAESVATLLLLEQGLRQNKMAIDDLAALFNRPSSVVVLKASVKGFAMSLLRLLDAGDVLPGRTQTLDVSYIRPGSHVRFADDLDIRWRIVTMLCEPDSDDPADVADSEMRRRLVNIARAGYPLLVIDENAAVSSLLSLAADQVVTVGAIDADVIAETAAKVAGHDVGSVRSALGFACLDLPRLSVADLSVAIRPGVSIDRTVQLLQYLLDGKKEDQDDSGSATATATPFGGSTALPGDRDHDGDRDRKTSSLSASARDRQGKNRPAKDKTDASAASGTEVLLPDASTQPYRLDVETLAGFGAARDWALDLKADLALWRQGSLTWDQLSSRLLLSGPPGTGKTTFARALCNSLDLPLHVSSVSTWLEASYLGSVITRMNAAFESARRNAPSILFIDECDGIGKRQPQDREFADYWNALVNKLLELMDGAARAEGVIIVGATNRPEAMDEALKRSGRWETQIAIPMPDRDALVGIFTHHLGADLAAVVATARPSSAMPHRPEEVETALIQLARQAVGLSGADVERLVREARGKARREARALSHDDLAAGLAKGRPKRSKALRYRMAIHEAGHAVVRCALKIGTEVGLTIEAATGGYAEAMHDLDVVQSKDWMMALIAVYLGGRAAETIVFGDASNGSGGSPTSDLANATRLALSMEIQLGYGTERSLLHRSMDGAELLLLRDDPLSQIVHERLEAAFGLATRTLSASRTCLLALADALADAGSLNAAEIAAVFAAHPVHTTTEEPGR